jgi:hypothetical protein
MKKLTLSIGLVAAILSAKAQDTTCTYFTGKEVYEFDYQMDTILYSVDFKVGGELQVENIGKFYEIPVEYGNTLCLDLSDHKNRVRKVITTFFDGTTRKDILDSGDDVYYTPRGVVKVSVGKSRNIILSR